MIAESSRNNGPEPLWWDMQDGIQRCRLCFHHCSLPPGRRGICGVREGATGKPALPGYGMITAASVDPIEKKPLYHFRPGEPVYSVGFAGCNLRCPFCQNHGIAEAAPEIGHYISPEELVESAISSGSRMIAYTYSEPTVHIEYLMHSAFLAREKGLFNVLVSNGSLNSDPARQLLELMDAANIDLKSWSGDYYQKVLKGRLDTVKEFTRIAAELCWTEVTTLVVPGDNDGMESMGEMSEWISGISPDIPLHLSAYHPAHRYDKAATSAASLSELASVAADYLNFIYLGNVGLENNTHCPNCRAIVVHRRYYSTESRLHSSSCPECGTVIPGRFK